MQYIEGMQTFPVGVCIQISNRISLVYHPTFVLYQDGNNSTTFVSILFPDGIETKVVADLSSPPLQLYNVSLTDGK